MTKNNSKKTKFEDIELKDINGNVQYIIPASWQKTTKKLRELTIDYSETLFYRVTQKIKVVSLAAFKTTPLDQRHLVIPDQDEMWEALQPYLYTDPNYLTNWAIAIANPSSFPLPLETEIAANAAGGYHRVLRMWITPKLKQFLLWNNWANRSPQRKSGLEGLDTLIENSEFADGTLGNAYAIKKNGGCANGGMRSKHGVENNQATMGAIYIGISDEEAEAIDANARKTAAHLFLLRNNNQTTKEIFDLAKSVLLLLNGDYNPKHSPKEWVDEAYASIAPMWETFLEELKDNKVQEAVSSKGLFGKTGSLRAPLFVSWCLHQEETIFFLRQLYGFELGCDQYRTFKSFCEARKEGCPDTGGRPGGNQLGTKSRNLLAAMYARCKDKSTPRQLSTRQNYQKKINLLVKTDTFLNSFVYTEQPDSLGSHA
jgi:hypothetical protein